ncbi:molybdopterin oxidoreductase family protein [Auraticoccus monumenti]|uniref:Assimilatory nitrate reductase (NADH) alpha subunit apoprotein n=1 Tax=Auraticoccus monumenti TaxID=675864 RepID=A0A1G7DI36_9ACTN|nr:molybdopterin oxidoreductase family protein [Auraticoccus monumenti]SDE51171.1 assimilatory nitrate reductase (NADH) alpha subunit apoprotein [Auraticoccus monumenti]
MDVTEAVPTATHCPYCALQCAQTLTRTPTGVEVSARDFPTNRGGMCQKGWTSARLLDVPDRLTTPLLRVGGELVEVDWDTALDHLAGRLAAIRAESGPDAVAVFGGGGLTNEKAYQLGKFARVALGTANIDYNGRFCMSSAAAAANRSLGLDRGLPFPLEDLRGAQAVLLLGSNLAETMPPGLNHLADVRAGGGLLVVDPRRSATAALAADGGGLHLQPVPGTDLPVLLGLTHVVLRDGLADEQYLATRTSGAEDVRASVSAWWPERVEQVTGVPVASLVRAARRLAAASPVHGGTGGYVLTGRGVEQSSQGTDTVTAAINLALVLGLCGRQGSGYGAITGQGNGQGGREHGQKADQLPGYRMIDDPAARAHVAGVWGVHPDSLPGRGLPAVALLASLGTPGGPRALMVHGANVRVSAPNAGDVAERLAALDLLVVCDIVPSETARLADVVLPVTQWAEEEGTMTSLEGRVIRRRRAVPAPDGVRSELWILSELARRLGAPSRWPTAPAEVFDELARASAGGRADYSGLSHARLDGGEALFWPCPAVPAGSPAHPGTPRPFLDRFPTPDGRARMVPVEHRGPQERPDAGRPLHLVTGRVLQHYQSGAQTRRVPELLAASPEAFAELHPLTAERLGVADGVWVRLSNRRGEVRVRARLSADVRTDTVFVPFHFPGAGSVNEITNDAVDPVSQMPEFKVCAVDLRPEVPAGAAPAPAVPTRRGGGR